MASAVRSTPKGERAGLELHPDDAAHLVLGAGEMKLAVHRADHQIQPAQDRVHVADLRVVPIGDVFGHIDSLDQGPRGHR